MDLDEGNTFPASGDIYLGVFRESHFTITITSLKNNIVSASNLFQLQYFSNKNTLPGSTDIMMYIHPGAL